MRLTPRQIDGLARWILRRLDRLPEREIALILRRAQQLTEIKKDGRPPTWSGVFGQQALAEFTAVREANNMTREEAIEECWPHWKRRRFTKRSAVDRGLKRAARRS